MKRAIWVHQFSQQSEQSPQDYADTLLPRGITAVYVKAMDGTSWMAEFYNHSLAPRDPTQFAGVVAQFAAVGLELVPWVVPRFKGAEAMAHLGAAAVANSLIVDWEYQYAGFWTGTDSEALVYYDTLRAASQAGQWIAVAPDPRQPGRDYSSAMIAGLSSYLPQTYWTDFQRPALNVLDAAWAAPLGPFEPILPANSTPEDMSAALEWCVAHGVSAVSTWRMGTANAAQLDAFATKAAGEDTEPQDPGDVSGCGAQRDSLVNSLGYIAGDALKPVAKLKLTSQPKAVQRLVAAIRDQAEQQGIAHA